MDTGLDIKFTEKSESIVTQFGFKNLKSFVKNQALLMLVARIEKYLLEKIANVLVNKDFSEAQIWVPQEFLDYVAECIKQYEQSNDDYQLFCT